MPRLKRPLRDRQPLFRSLQLGHTAQYFSTHSSFPGALTGHHAFGRSKNRYSQPTEHSGNLSGPDVNATAGLGNPIDARDSTFPSRAVTQRDPENFLLFFFNHLEVSNVALILQDVRNFCLQPGAGHVHTLMARMNAIPDSRQHIGNWISDCHSCVWSSLRSPWYLRQPEEVCFVFPYPDFSLGSLPTNS